MSKSLKNHLRFGAAVSASIITGILFSGVVIAHGGATGIIKERMTMMKDIGDNMKQVGAMIKGKETFDSTKIANHAMTISEVSPKIFDLFPKDSLNKPTEALPAIWDEWDNFSALTLKLTDEAIKLQDTAQNGDKRAITMQFVKLGKVCSSCHTNYRKKQEK